MADDVKSIHWEDLVRAHPEMFLPVEDLTPTGIGRSLQASAELLGAGRTRTAEIDGWWYFCSDVDWIFNSSHVVQSITEVFLGPCPFPEMQKPNVFRFEALCTPFSSDVYTIAGSKLVVLKGNPPSPIEVENHLRELGEWGRIVGYKPDFTFLESRE